MPDAIDNPADVSTVLPDGSTTALQPDPGSDGTRPAESFDNDYQARQAYETKWDERLADIYDKMNSEDDEKPSDEKKAEGARDDKALVGKRETLANGRVVFRGTDGQFRNAEGKLVDHEGAPIVAGEAGKGTEAQTEDTDGQEAATVEMPKSWSPEKDKEVWDSLPPAAKQMVAEREKEAHTTISRQGQVLAAFKPIGDIILENRSVFDRHGAHPVEGIKTLLSVQNQLDADPIGTIMKIAEQYSVDLASELGITIPVDREGKPIPRDQAMDMLRRQVTKLERQLTGYQNETVAAQRREMQRRQAETDTLIANWASQPGHEHFEDVRDMMSSLIIDGHANDLEEAYQQACQASPVVSKKIAAQREAERKAAEDATAKKRREQESKRVAEAKRQSTLQVGGGNRQVRRGQASGSWSDDKNLEAIYDRIASR